MNIIPQKPRKKSICPCCKQKIPFEFLQVTNELEKQIALKLRNEKIDRLVCYSFLLTKWQHEFLNNIRHREFLTDKQSTTLDSIWAEITKYCPDLLPKPLIDDS